MPATPQKKNLAAIFYTAVFLDLLGFGMLIPDIQLRAEKMGASGWLIGLILAAMFIVQVPVSPLWGKTSDRIGRKPVFLACTAFSASGMMIYGFAQSLPLLGLSRVLSGFGGANVSVAQALLADRSTPENRAVLMGRISAAVSVGLILGPVIGGVIAGALGSRSVGWIGGSCSAFGGLLVLLLVPNLPPKVIDDKSRKIRPELNLLRELPKLRGLVMVAVISWFSLATLEGTFGRLIDHTMGFGQLQFGIVFGYESLLGFLVQGLLIGWLTRTITEIPLLRSGYLLQGLGLAITPFAYLLPSHAAWLPALLLCSTAYAFGSAVSNPTMNSLCSRLTPVERQGELFGLLQGARSVGFILGPIIGGTIFDRWFASPYLLAGATCALAAWLLGKLPVPVES